MLTKCVYIAQNKEELRNAREYLTQYNSAGLLKTPHKIILFVKLEGLLTFSKNAEVTRDTIASQVLRILNAPKRKTTEAITDQEGKIVVPSTENNDEIDFCQVYGRTSPVILTDAFIYQQNILWALNCLVGQDKVHSFLDCTGSELIQKLQENEPENFNTQLLLGQDRENIDETRDQKEIARKVLRNYLRDFYLAELRTRLRLESQTIEAVAVSADVAASPLLRTASATNVSGGSSVTAAAEEHQPSVRAKSTVSAVSAFRNNEAPFPNCPALIDSRLWGSLIDRQLLIRIREKTTSALSELQNIYSASSEGIGGRMFDVRSKATKIAFIDKLLGSDSATLFSEGAVQNTQQIIYYGTKLKATLMDACNEALSKHYSPPVPPYMKITKTSELVEVLKVVYTQTSSEEISRPAIEQREDKDATRITGTPV